MDSTHNAPLAAALKYSGLVLPLLAIAVWVAGPHHPVTGPLPQHSSFTWRFLLINSLLACAIILQGWRFRWFVGQKIVGTLLLFVGSVYTAMVVIFGLTANLR
jgi:hypothetical protein